MNVPVLYVFAKSLTPHQRMFFLCFSRYVLFCFVLLVFKIKNTICQLFFAHHICHVLFYMVILITVWYFVLLMYSCIVCREILDIHRYWKWFNFACFNRSIYLYNAVVHILAYHFARSILWSVVHGVGLGVLSTTCHGQSLNQAVFSVDLSQRNKAGLNVLSSVCPSIHRKFTNLNRIWCVDRCRWVIHDGILYDPIQG